MQDLVAREAGEEGGRNSEPKMATEEDSQNQNIRTQAMNESLEYFKQQEADIENWLASNECESALATLVEMVKNNRVGSLEELKRELQLPPDKEKWLPAMLEATKQCEPISNIASAVEFIKQIIKEKASASVQIMNAMSHFDAGTSWYHTTDEGKARLRGIIDEAS